MRFILCFRLGYRHENRHVRDHRRQNHRVRRHAIKAQTESESKASMRGKSVHCCVGAVVSGGTGKSHEGDVLWVLYAVQWATWRCTHPKKRNETKAREAATREHAQTRTRDLKATAAELSGGLN